MYKLNFQTESWPLLENNKFYQGNLISDGNPQLYTDIDGKLYCFYFNQGKWKVFNITGENLVGTQQMYFSDILGTGQEMLITKDIEGIKFFQYNNSKIILINISQDFHEFFKWSKYGNKIIFGHMYHDKSLVGILTKHHEFGLKFYYVNKTELFEDESPLWTVDENHLNQYKLNETKFYLTDLKHTGQDNVIARTVSGLNVYKFNEEEELDLVMEIACCHNLHDLNDHIFFSNITGSLYQDVLNIDNGGLNLYKYDAAQGKYHLINHHPLFSLVKGWTNKHTDTVTFLDINFDGKTEMIFTGPQSIGILTFNNIYNNWQSVLDNFNLKVNERHGLVVNAVSQFNDIILLTYYSQSLQWTFVQEINSTFVNEQVFRNNYQEICDSNLNNKLIITDPPNDKDIVFLRDQLDYSFIMNAVNTATGRIKFILPLVDIPNLITKLNILYDSSSADILGFGWSFPQNLIALNHQSSVFPEDSKYFLIHQNVYHELMIDTKNSTENIYHFQLKTHLSKLDSMQIIYHKTNEQWEIKTEGLKRIYGNLSLSNLHSEAVMKETRWINWRGEGSSPKDKVELAAGWYLSQVSDEYNNTLYYHYIQANKSSSENYGVKSEIYLKQITDNAGNSINLNYEQISDDEQLAKSKNSINKLYLKGYSVYTSSITQEVDFLYKISYNKRLLTSISDKSDNRPVLQFVYNNDSLIQKVEFSNRASIEYTYRSVKELASVADQRREKVITVEKNYQIFYGNDYKIISCINSKGHLEIKIFNDGMDKELYSSLSSSKDIRIPKLGKHKIEFYEIFSGDNYFAIKLWYNKIIDMYLFRWNKSKLLLSPKNYSFTNEAIVRLGKDFIAVTDIDSKLVLIEWNDTGNKWTTKNLGNENNGLLSTIASSNRILLIYDDRDLKIWYKNNDNEWISKTIKHLPNLLKNIRDALDRFNLSREVYKYIYFQSRNNVLQINNNLVLLSTWALNGTQFYSQINLFVLNNKYEIALEKREHIEHEDMRTLTKEYQDKQGNKYNCRFTQVGNKFRPIIDSFSGPVKKKLETIERDTKKNIENSRMWQHQKYQYLEEFYSELNKQYIEFKKNATEALDKLKIFPLDYAKYYGILRAPVVLSHNLKFNFTGSEWNVEEIKEEKKGDSSEMLGDRYMLHQANAGTSIKLYRVRDDGLRVQEHLVDLNVKHFGQILNRYPFYLAYHEENNVGYVIEFTSDGSISEKCALPVGEKLSSFSSYQGIFTEKPLKPKGLALIYRSLQELNCSISSSVITQSTLTYDDKRTRINGFEYNFTSSIALDDSILFEQSTLIPGNDKKSFGWIEETVISNSSRKVIYNGNGEVVKTVTKPLTPEPDEETEDIPRNSTIFDKSNKFPIAYFFPFNLDSELVSYYGFEDYEVNSVGKHKRENIPRWIFNNSNIKRNRFSFTGANYLELNSGETVNASFNLSDNKMTFIASTWIRPEFEIPGIGSTTPYLKIIASTEDGKSSVGFLSEVKQRSSDWYYLESIVNLFDPTLNINLNQNNDNNKSALLIPNVNITIVISPGTNSTLHVDHVRFTPISCRFRANVFDHLTRSLKEEIQANGLVKRYVYDKYLEKIATIDEYGQLIEFNTYTKVTSTGAIPQPYSNIIIKSASGFYEDFSSDSFTYWKIAEPKNFKVSPSVLHHTSHNSDSLSLCRNAVDANSYGLRLIYSLMSENAKIKFNNAVINVFRNAEGSYFSAGSKKLSAPITGELLIIVEKNRISLWLDGGLYLDSGNVNFKSNNDLSVVDIKLEGLVQIKHVMIFNKLNVLVTYFNSLGEQIQEIKLEDENNVIVNEYLYDPIGRQSITTKPIRIELDKADIMLAYYSLLVVNSNPYSQDSVWKTGVLKGVPIGNSVIGEFDYSEIKYNNDVLEEERLVGYPGKEFSAYGPFAKKYDKSCHIYFLSIRYPLDKGYKCRTEYKSGGVLEVSVSDTRDNIVARYIHVPRSRDLLSTYKYDRNNRLVTTLPPLYHQKAKTFDSVNPEPQSTSKEELELLALLGTHWTYDDTGNILTKKTSDSGKVENIFDEHGLLKFIVYYKFQDDNKVDKIIYFDYDGLFRLKRSGLLTTSTSVDSLLSTIHNNTQTYQEFYYNDADSDPTVRGRVRRTITFNEHVPFFEEFLMNDQKKTVNKRITIPIKEDEPLYVEINKRYAGKQLKQVAYPIEFQNEPFVLTYEYSKLGKIKSIGVRNNKSLFFRFVYNPSGQVIREVHCPDSVHSFTRHYSYNSPGYLTSLTDKFLTEDISYTEPGYGGIGYGDGTITRTEFQATWHNSSINENIALNERSFISKYITTKQSKECYNKLKEAGYIDHSNHQSKIFYSELEVNVPNLCSNREVSNTLGQKGFPIRYGHMYDYGNHLELTKAKYFVGDERPSPLHPDSFARDIPALSGNTTLSYKIWQTLKDSFYLIQDLDKENLSMAYGKGGRSFIRSSLAKDLESIDVSYKVLYLTNISKLLISCFVNSQTLSLSEFIEIFSKWKIKSKLSDQEVATKIYKIFQEGNYFKNPLDEQFLTAMKEFADIVPDIIRILQVNFAKELGKAEFDVESYDIDANGNHKHYYTGFSRFHINYQDNTNRIETVQFVSFSDHGTEETFPMEHDNAGNVVQAMHKGIKLIQYDPVLNRASKIHLIDGRCITFAFDSQGERIYKKVENKLGQVIKEVHYIRDEHGRSLVERELTYVSVEMPPVLLTTAYIYGPHGLIGFIRRDEFYSVVCDHENSIRLVVKNSEVVAAYDYLPYGNMVREFASYPEAHISYRYTGQEWDEEVGLYNYHARLYDPSIGRFYQIDPKAQYFSPYMYAGNSPVSIVDPDGEFAFTLAIIVAALVGGYLGGASANNTFNLTKWNWKSFHTWLGITGGVIEGLLIPFSFIGLIPLNVLIRLGFAGAYIYTAAATGEWNFTKWDYSSPQIWNFIFVGFGIGTGVAGFKDVGNFFSSLTRKGKAIFIGSSVVTGAAFVTLEGFANDWDLSRPEFWFGVAAAIVGAPELPMLLGNLARFVRKKYFMGKYLKKIKRMAALENNNFSHFKKMKSEWIPIAKCSSEIFSGAVVTGLSSYLVGSAVNEDFQYWDMNSVGSYIALINGFQTGAQLSQSGKHFYKAYKMKNKIDLLHNLEDIARSTADLLNTMKQTLKSNKGAGLSLLNEIYGKFKTNIDSKQFSVEFLKHMKVRGIPNPAIAVGTNNKYLISEFSSHEAPGLIMFFNHKKMSSPSFIFEEFLDKNGRETAGKEVAISDDSARDKYLLNSIRETQVAMNQINVNKFVSNVENFKNILSTFKWISRDEIDGIISNIKYKIIEEGFLKDRKKAVTEELSQLVDKAISVRTADKKYYIQELNEVLMEKKKQMKNPEFMDHNEKLTKEVQELKTHIHYLEKEVQDIENIVIAERDKVVDSIWEQLEKYEEDLTFWAPISCAEQHVLSVNSNMENILRGSVGSFNTLTSDIKFISTYKLKDTLTPFERCDQCKIRTSHVKNIVTDPEWNEILNDNLLKKVNEKNCSSMERLHFLIPYEAMLNPFHQANNAIEHCTNKTNTKVKRSLYTNVEIENDMFIKSATNGATTNIPFINNVFGWLKRTYNVYLSNTENYSNYSDEKQFKNEGTFSNSQYVFGRRWEDMISVESALLLANVLVAKLFNTRLSFPSNNDINYTDALAHSINITDRFEHEIQQTATEFDLPEQILTCMNFVELQSLIMPKIISNEPQEIYGILNRYLVSNCSADVSDEYQIINREIFLDKMSRNINIMMNDFLTEILDENKVNETTDYSANQELLDVSYNRKSGIISLESPKMEGQLFPSEVISSGSVNLL